jgi:lipopolysaccharide biosynthesis protein
MQLNNTIVKKYKYFCHIHSKKTTFTNFGDDWRQYLLENLLGSTDIVSEILTDFENNDKLGFIFPETYYKVLLEYGSELTRRDKLYIKYLLKKVNKNAKIGNIIDFPAGNMFWAKVEAVYQIFNLNILDTFPKENYQVDGTIMHGIERFWLFLVKMNNFYYKKIFKHF